MRCAYLRRQLELSPRSGIDIGKDTFHLVGLDKRGAIVLQELCGELGDDGMR